MAAVTASQDERLLEGGVMRVLGASRAQLRLAQASEFIAIGAISGLTAAAAASLLSGVVATRVFDLPWQFDAKPAVIAAFRRSISRLGELPCDIVVSTHPSATNLDAKIKKRAELKGAGPDPFVDQGCKALAATAMKNLEARIAEEKK